MIKSAKGTGILIIVVLLHFGVPVTMSGPLGELRTVVRKSLSSGLKRRSNGAGERGLGKSHGSGGREVSFKNLDDVEHHCMRHQVVDPLLVVFTVEAWKLVGRNGERL